MFLKKFPLICFLFIAAIGFAHAAKQAQITAYTLSNGMKVIIRENHSINLAAVDIWVNTGVSYETPETNGISHFIEHMIFKTTSRFASGQIDREIENMGAELNGGTSKDWVHFYTTAASQYLPSVIDVLADAITNAKFTEEDVEKERSIILDEIARADSNEIKSVMNLFAENIYGDHPYSLSPAGKRENISRFTRDELFSFYKKMYTPSNICVAISGDVVPADALESVRKSFINFADTPSSYKKTEPKSVIPPKEPNAIKYTLPYKKSHVILGFMTTAASDLNESCALDAIAVILGNTNSGRLASAFNTAGINVSYIDSDYIDQKYPSAFTVHVIADTTDTEKVSSIILSELRYLAAEPATQSELTYAKRITEGGYLFDQETFAGQARMLGLYNAVSSWEMSLKYGSVVSMISAGDIMKTAAKYYLKDNYTLLVTEPEGKSE